MAIDGNRFSLLAIESSHAAQLSILPHHHRDPFDRMIIAQAIVEGMTVVSCDKAFDAYPVKRIW
ncbi:MAG: type II toxin-antitoxin system VapC family toxin [Planctomycetaceae bacterium]